MLIATRSVNQIDSLELRRNSLNEILVCIDEAHCLLVILLEVLVALDAHQLAQLLEVPNLLLLLLFVF